MRSWLLVGVALLVACSSGADAADEADESVGCDDGGLGCVLIDEDDLAEAFGEEVTISPLQTAQLGATVSWCDRPMPAPVERLDRGYGAESQINGVTVALTSTALRYDGADAEVTMTVLSELRQGCSWQEGQATFRFLDHLDVADFGNDTIGLLMQVELGGEQDNAELVVVRSGSVLSQVGLFPAQDAPALWDALARRIDERLAPFAG